MRLWSVQARPDAFRLIAGEAELTDYRGNNQVAHHLFCRRCGVRAFEWVDVPNMTGGKYFNVNVMLPAAMSKSAANRTAPQWQPPV